MTSRAFNRVLKATGYLTDDGNPVPGLTRSADADATRLRVVLRDDSVGLHADAAFTTQGAVAAIFKDAGDHSPTDDEIRSWHEAAWNVGVAPLLWVITPTDVRLYNCYASPARDETHSTTYPIDQFTIDVEERIRALDTMCGRLATETGAFWSSIVGSKIDRRHRVDRELLSEINALEEQLTILPPASPDAQLSGASEIKASRDFAQRLIGRCIFTWYLIDRNIAQPFLPESLRVELSEIFATEDRAFALFEWLRGTFDGDLFPMNDPGAERSRMGPRHLALVREFVLGRSLVPGNQGQGRLFRFRFNAIPVDLISSIYQQFARSSAEEEARVQGLHYTPMELVHLTLDPVFENLPSNARIIDPTCGSGAFLVEAFRRLVWKGSKGGRATRAMVRSILYNQLFGIDINKSALGIAAFSLYLAALEFDEDPIVDKREFKFDHLIGKTLFEANALDENLPIEVTDKSYTAVIGNPPWTFDSKTVKRRKKGGDQEARPRRSPDQAFLNLAARLAGSSGRIGMIMKASPFFSLDQYAVQARNDLIKKLSPIAIVNLSALRKEKLFPDASGPALLFFARCELMPRGDQLLVGSVPWTADFQRNGIFNIGPGELRTISLKKVLETPSVLKAATFGTVRDSWLIERLTRDFPTFADVLDDLGLKPLKTRGQGYQVEGDANVPPDHFYALKNLTPDAYTPFRIDGHNLENFEHKTLHRTRENGIYLAPILVCPKASFKLSSELGRYSSAVSSDNVIYSESFYGISFQELSSRWAFFFNAILNSCLTTFQLAFGGGAWGLERSTVEPKDLLSLRVPHLRYLSKSSVQHVIDAEAEAAKDIRPASLANLDAAVGEIYGLDRDELALTRDSIQRSRMLIFESLKQRKAFIRPPTSESLNDYATAVVGVVDNYLRAKGERHLEATIYRRALVSASWPSGTGGLTAVRFAMASGKPGREPIVNMSEGTELGFLADRLRGRLQAELPPYLNERRQLRLYLEKELYTVKPSELRYWSRTAGLNDADIILADHWLRNRHASYA